MKTKTHKLKALIFIPFAAALFCAGWLMCQVPHPKPAKKAVVVVG